ncbi:hypothetical protein Hanom_Chr07g00607051 [Helianthus anomalus]
MFIRHVPSSTRPGLVTSEGTKWIFPLVEQLGNAQLVPLLLHKSLAINRRLNLQV